MVSHESIRGLLGVAGSPGRLLRWIADYANTRSAATTTRALHDEVGVRGLPPGRRRQPACRSRSGSTSRRSTRPATTPTSAPGTPGRTNCSCPLWSVVDREAAGPLGPGAGPPAGGRGGRGAGGRRRRAAAAAAGAGGRVAAGVVRGLRGRPAGLATLLASADVALAPGPVETFGLAALEALACGTPVVVDRASALPEVVAGGRDRGTRGRRRRSPTACASCWPGRRSYAAAEPGPRRNGFTWSRSVAGFLDSHQGADRPRSSGERLPVRRARRLTTVGMGDPMPDGRWRGWAALVANCLPNGAGLPQPGRGRRALLTLHERQLPAALDLAPDLAAVVVGANDTLRGTFDVGATARALESTVSALRRPARSCSPPGCPTRAAAPAAGRVRPSAGAADLGRQRGPRRLRRPARHTAPGHDRAARGVRASHVERRPVPSERAWAPDVRQRLPRPAAIGRDSLYGGVDPEPTNPPPTRLAGVRWLATRGVKWVLDRSTDLVPSLTRWRSPSGGPD
jgi:hypothetical protein